MANRGRGMRLGTLIGLSLTMPAAAASTKLSVFSGPSSPTPLVDLARGQNTRLEPDLALGLAFGRPFAGDAPGSSVVWEWEGHAVQYVEPGAPLSLGAMVILRWRETPWSGFAPGASFGFGHGLSWATAVPRAESRILERTSRVLYAMALEAAVPVGRSGWEALFRIQHRSGAFGLFDGVVGGSDFLCLGARWGLSGGGE